MLKFYCKSAAIIVLFLTICSCTSKKKIIYFQGASTISAEINKNYTPIFHTDDLLSITVMGLDLESVKPYNMPVSNFNNNMGGYASGTPSPPGYLIDSEGNIELPGIGKLKLAGLDRNGAIAMIKEKLKDQVKDPTINIRILNYKVTVLGEVKNPGTFTIPNERITLPEALGIAGDLNITALRKNVLVIRDVDGKKTQTSIDLTSNELFSSPVYYLHQNDVVYIQPNRAKINSSVVNASNVGIFISVISLLTTIALLISR
jgi:polysaccharide biosynthesis/export protein